MKPYTEDVIHPLWQPVRGCRTAVADAVVPCSETGGVAPGRISSDLWHFSSGTATRSHTAGRFCKEFPSVHSKANTNVLLQSEHVLEPDSRCRAYESMRAMDLHPAAAIEDHCAHIAHRLLSSEQVLFLRDNCSSRLLNVLMMVLFLLSQVIHWLEWTPISYWRLDTHCEIFM